MIENSIILLNSNITLSCYLKLWIIFVIHNSLPPNRSSRQVRVRSTRIPKSHRRSALRSTRIPTFISPLVLV